jgi:hypothetical protein
MVKLFKTIPATLIIGFSIAQAAVTHVSQTRVQPGHPALADISPIPSADGELEGFLLCDSGRAVLTVLTADWDTAYTVPLARPARTAVAFRSADHDTLYFCAAADGDMAPVLYLITRINGRTNIQSWPVRSEQPLGKLLTRRCSLTLHHTSDRPTSIVLTISEIIEEHLVTQGTLTEAHARAYVFDLAERDFTQETAADRVAIGEFDGDGSADLAGNRILWSQWGERDDSNVNLMPGAGIDLSITSGRTIELVRHRREISRVSDLAMLDLTPFVGADELVVAGAGADWMANHVGLQGYLAAYCYSAGQVEELWYNRHEPVTLLLPYLFRGQLVAFQGPRRLLFFDPRSGDPVDSVDLDRDMDQVRLLSGVENSRSLYLTGRSGDTLISARIDQETIRATQAERPENALPKTFILEQNYPNPFNGSTQLRFTNKLGQHLSLRIYNVLGQEIATLVDNMLPPGEFDYTWDATNNLGEIQGSGIYFAQLKSAGESHIIKLIYLK